MEAISRILPYVMGGVTSVALAGFMYLRLRPHRAKVFLSHSHLDKEIAIQIRNALKRYQIRVWADIGIVFPAGELERILSELVGDREIFVLIASKHSVCSQWVNFELMQAKRPTDKEMRAWGWRDFIVLATDETGVEIADALQDAFNADRERSRKAHADMLKEMERELADARKESHLRYWGTKFVIGLYEHFCPDAHPSVRRAFHSSVKLFRIGEDRNGDISAFIGHLKHSTKRPPPDIPFLQELGPVILAMYLAVLAVSAACVLKGIGYFEMLRRIFTASFEMRF